MVYVYVCKRFKVTMEMVSGKDSEWILNLVKFYLKHRRKEMQKLERAEVNPKRRVNTCSYDSSSDVFKINLVYKDQKGVDQELKWIIKVTRSDVNETANLLLRHEKQVFSRLVADLVNSIKQKSASFSDGARVNFKDLILVPEYIYDETSHAADVTRNVLVLDNLEERKYYSSNPGPLNLSHFKCAVKTIAKFHAAGLCHKQMLWHSFAQQSNQAQASKSFEDVEVEGENKVPVGKEGLFARFPFLSERMVTMNHLISNRQTFLDMYQQLLMCFPAESHLLHLFQYIRMSTDDILGVNENEDNPTPDHPLDSIAVGVLEARSFLFFYEEDEDKENKASKTAKVQRSHSDRSSSRKNYVTQKSVNKDNKDMPAKPKCPKIDTNVNKSDNKPPSSGVGIGGNRVANNKLFQHVKKCQDDAVVPPLQLRKKDATRNPNAKPLRAALVNAKYVTYTRVTNDLAVLFFTSGDTLLRRFYMIKMVECFAETIGITLSNLGIDTDKFQLSWTKFVMEFQTHILYGFLVGVLVAMANTDVVELNEMIRNSGRTDQMEVDGQAGKQDDPEYSNRFISLSLERVEFLLDLMRDIGSYVESKDFELGLPVTNFARYHELWSMQDECADEEDEGDEDEEDEEEEDEEEEETE